MTDEYFQCILTKTVNRHQASFTVFFDSLALAKFKMVFLTADMEVLLPRFRIFTTEEIRNSVATAHFLANKVGIFVIPLSGTNLSAIYLHFTTTCL